MRNFFGTIHASHIEKYLSYDVMIIIIQG